MILIEYTYIAHGGWNQDCNVLNNVRIGDTTVACVLRVRLPKIANARSAPGTATGTHALLLRTRLLGLSPA